MPKRPLRFLIDAQLPRAIGACLAADRHEAIHIKDAIGKDAPDHEIWEWAAARNHIIVTKDVDFAIRVNAGAAGPSVVWIRIGNATRRSLEAKLEAVWPRVCRELERGSRLVEVTDRPLPAT